MVTVTQQKTEISYSYLAVAEAWDCLYTAYGAAHAVQLLKVMLRLPHKLSANTPQAVLINQIIDYLASLTPKDSDTVKVNHGLFGVLFKIETLATKTALSRFNITGEYDPGKTYKTLDCAIISNVSASGHALYIGRGWWMQSPMGQLGTWL